MNGHRQKYVCPVWSQDSKIDCILRMNRWNELIFACRSKFRKAKSYFNDFWLLVVRNECGYFMGPQNLLYLKNLFIN